MKIRSHLAILVLGAVTPLLVAAVVVGGLLLDKERETLRSESIGRVRSAMSAVDVEVRNHITTMRALAASRNLQAGDIRAFHAEAQRVLASQQPYWSNIALATVDRRQVMDAIRPAGDPVPFRANEESFDRAIRTREVAVGALRAGPAVPNPSVPIRMPVIVDNEVRYVLSVPVDASAFQRVLAAQNVPAGWRIGLVDRDKRFIGRIPEVAVATPATPDFIRHVSASPEGWYRGTTREGDDAYTPYVTSRVTGWVLGTGIPAAEIDAPLRHSFWIVAAGLLIALVASVGLTVGIARRIEDPVRDVVAATQSMSEGGVAGPPANRRIDEIAHLHDGLHAAALAIKERERLLERERRTLLDQAQLLDLAHDAILVRSRTGVIKFWSDGAQEIYGWSKVEAIGRVKHELLQTQFPLPLHEIDEQLDRDGRWEGVLVQRRKDGSLLTVASRWTLRREPERDVEVVLTIDSDISQQVQAQEAIAQLNEQLREENRRKDRFLATLAHELRNPLAPIRNCVTVLNTGNAAASDVAWAHGVIERQVTQMARLLDDLLDISRVAHGKLQLKRERVSMRRVIDAALETCRPQLATHELSVDLEPDEFEIHVDALRIGQVVSNLINNAAKYSGDGLRIWLRARAEGDTAVISVKDEGIGISAEMLPRVFELFTQAGPGGAHAQGGMGIGLALVRALTEMHGGSVEARSEGDHRGSEFIVRLRGAVVVDTPALPVAREPDGAGIAPTHFVVADDLADSADSLAALLRLEGHKVTVAYDGIAAFEAVERERPRIALLDLGMPQRDGYEVARMIRAQPWGRGMLLVALSGWGQREDRARTQEAGFDYHLVKPLALEELNRLLRVAPRRSATVVTLVNKDVA